MTDKHERESRAQGRKPQMNFEATEAEKVYFSRVADAKGMKLAALIRELLHTEGRRLGLSMDDDEQLARGRNRKLKLLIGRDPDTD